MTEQTESHPNPSLHVSPGPHAAGGSRSTRGMMTDVLIALGPVLVAALLTFGPAALLPAILCTAAALAAEALFTAMRGRRAPLADCSAAVTGVILGLSLPATTPWYVAVIGSFAAIGFGKAVFGGLGYNLFNPAMVGRAFVMIAFPAALGASAYVVPDSSVDVLTAATPLTLLKQAGETTPLLSLFLGTTNGSLGETSAAACLIGGLYLCFRRSASWQIPAGVVASIAILSGVGDLVGASPGWSVLHQLASGSLLFGAFFIATDPVSSPLTPKGKWIFGAGVGALVALIRSLSGYPEGVMFAVLLMNAVTPLINRWTIPTPLGGPVPAPQTAG